MDRTCVGQGPVVDFLTPHKQEVSW